MTHLFLILGITTLYALGMLESRKGNTFFVAGMVVHLGYLISRGVTLGHIPVTNRYDILGLMAFLTAAAYLYLPSLRKIRGIMGILPLLPVVLCFLAMFQERMDTVNPFMSSRWFFLYMMLFAGGYALMAVGSVLGVLYLRHDDHAHEGMQYRFTLAGWMLFSCSLIAGSVWFYLSYGVYWLWTAKELWTTIVWLYYGFYLHARYVNAMKGPVASEIGAAGFFVMMFSYLGVTPILGSPWTQF